MGRREAERVGMIGGVAASREVAAAQVLVGEGQRQECVPARRWHATAECVRASAAGSQATAATAETAVRATAATATGTPADAGVDPTTAT